jgi:hypothetical protein
MTSCSLYVCTHKKNLKVEYCSQLDITPVSCSRGPAFKYRVRELISWPASRSSPLFLRADAGMVLQIILFLILLAVAPSEAQGIRETYPPDPVGYQSFYFFPCFASGTPISMSTPRVSIQCSRFDDSSRFPQGMTDPVPFSSLYLSVNWLLVCNCPEVFIWVSFRPSYIYDSAYTSINKILQHVSDLFCDPPCLTLVLKMRTSILLEIYLFLQIRCNWIRAPVAFFIRFLTSSSAPPFLVIVLLK